MNHCENKQCGTEQFLPFHHVIVTEGKVTDFACSTVKVTLALGGKRADVWMVSFYETSENLFVTAVFPLTCLLKPGGFIYLFIHLLNRDSFKPVI